MVRVGTSYSHLTDLEFHEFFLDSEKNKIIKIINVYIGKTKRSNKCQLQTKFYVSDYRLFQTFLDFLSIKSFSDLSKIIREVFIISIILGSAYTGICKKNHYQKRVRLSILPIFSILGFNHIEI